MKLQTLLTTSASRNKLYNGYTALHIAAEQKSAEWVQLLLEYGADVRLRTEPHQETALHLSTAQGNSEVFSRKLRLLLDFKADIDAQNVDGDTALHLAIARIGTVSGIRPLLEAGAYTNFKGREGRTPFLYAIYLEQEAVATLLLDKGSDPHSLDDRGRSALHFAIAAERLSIAFIERLISADVDVDWKDEEGHTPLYVAAQRNKRDVISLLLDHGADCQVGDPRLEKRVQKVQSLRKQGRRLPWPFG
jgi:ankyrin repeat protein